MFVYIDGCAVNPEKVVAVVTRGQKKKKGVVTSRGCTIWLEGGFIITTKQPTTQVASLLSVKE